MNAIKNFLRPTKVTWWVFGIFILSFVAPLFILPIHWTSEIYIPVAFWDPCVPMIGSVCKEEEYRYVTKLLSREKIEGMYGSDYGPVIFVFSRTVKLLLPIIEPLLMPVKSAYSIDLDERPLVKKKVVIDLFDSYERKQRKSLLFNQYALVVPLAFLVYYLIGNIISKIWYTIKKRIQLPITDSK